MTTEQTPQALPEPTVEEMKATLAALEAANLHLQAKALEHELQGLQAQQALIDIRGPQAFAQLEQVKRQLELRRPKPVGNVVNIKDPAA